MPIATIAFVVSALVFAPLSSYVAGRRARSPLVWFGLGILIGPLAPLLLLLAPPGHCPDCGARIRGWPRACTSCGAPLGGAIGWSRPTPSEPSVERLVVVRPVGGGSAVDAQRATPRPVLVPDPPRDRALAPDPAPGRSWTVGVGVPLSEAAAAKRRYREQQDHVGPTARLLGSGIYLGGSAPTATRVARLDVGDRYGLAREGDELQILGPVTFDPKRVVARVPLTGAEVEVVGDRLVVHGGPSARGTVIAFASLSVSRRIDLAAALGAPTDELAR